MSRKPPRYPWATPWSAVLLVLTDPELERSLQIGSLEHFARLVNVTPRHLYRVVAQLRREKLIRIEPRPKGSKRGSTYWWRRIETTVRGANLASKFPRSGRGS